MDDSAIPPPRRRRPDKAAIVAHEIRGPLGVVTALADLLAARDLGPEERRLVDLIRLAGLQSRMVAEDLVAETNLQSGSLETSLVETDLPRLVQQQCQLFEPLDSGARIIVDIADDAPKSTITDAARLSQILFNIITNALKVSGTAPVRVRLLRGRRKDSFAIEVVDSGPGLPDGFRIRPFNTSSNGGTGLGLWISTQIARALGGSLTLAPAPDGGTIARYDHPARRARRPRGAVPAKDTASGTGDLDTPANETPSATILIVDDSAVSRQLLVAIIESFGMATAVAAGTRDALEKVEKCRPDLIVTDWILNAETGGDVLSALQARLGEAMPPALLVTAARRLPASMARYPVVEKPFTPTEFHRALVRLLPGTAQNAENMAIVEGNLTLHP